jgi:hypothetical protein
MKHNNLLNRILLFCTLTVSIVTIIMIIIKIVDISIDYNLTPLIISSLSLWIGFLCSSFFKDKENKSK